MSELQAKETLIGKLEDRVGDLEGHIERLTKVLRVPRLVEQAKKRFNFNKVEIFKDHEEEKILA